MIKYIFVTITLIGSGLNLFGQNQDNVLEKATLFTTELIAGNYEKAIQFFADETVNGNNFNGDALKAIMKQLESQLGTFQSKEEHTFSKENDVAITDCVLRFKNGSLILKLAFNPNNEIIGMHFVPNNNDELELVKNDLIWEQAVTVETGKEIDLRGIITYPYKDSQYPAIVLVHGSGPQDMDLTYGPNKLFKELAHKLAEKGFVVLRYDKRTKVYAGKPQLDINQLTLKEETIDDALSAVDLLRKNERVDKKKIFVLGHSLGGMAAPMIAKQSGKKIAGLIILSGNARPLQDLITEQYEYLARLDNEVTQEEQKQIDQHKKAVKSLEELKVTGKVDSPLPFNLPPAYWNYLLNYDPIATALTIQQPIFIIQGKRDYQVTTTDYDLWKEGLKSKNNISFQLYEKLNHMFQEGESKSTPEEYLERQTVPNYLIEDIAKWINNKKN